MKINKKLATVCVFLISLGIIFVVISVIVGGGFAKMGFTDEKYNATKTFGNIKMDVGVSSLSTEFYDGEFIEVEYQTNKLYIAKIDDSGDVLKLTFNRVPAIFSFGSQAPQITVKIPKNCEINFDIDIHAGEVILNEGNYGNIDVDVGAGTFNFNGGECKSFNCEIGAGEAKINSLTAQSVNLDISAGKLTASNLEGQSVKCNVEVGSLKLGMRGKQEEYTIQKAVSLGSCNVSSQKGTTDKIIDIDCSAGEVKVTFSN